MIDINLIRDNPNLVKENIKKKFQNDKLPLVEEIIELDKKWRKLKFEEDNLRKERNDISLKISELKKSGKNAEKEIVKAKKIPEEIEKIGIQRKELGDKIKELMYKIPNIIDKSVPIGKDASHNVVIKSVGKPKKYSFQPKNHVELGEGLRILDFDTSAKTSGNGFYYMKGDLALLNVALINFARDFMIKKGFQYVEPPLMIREKILKGVYSNEDIAQMSYKIDGEDLFLIATAEHPMIGQFIDKTLNGKELPIMQTGYSMCFRKEIGSHGINEKGIFRTHQFNKQEMIIICEPEDSSEWYEKMLKMSIDFFKEIGIPFRILMNCSGDLGDLKAKACDLEAWSPVKKEYFEITSLTNMTDAQARRLNIWIENKGKRYLAHTLNNTVIATSRALVAIMENNQNKNGSINIPKVLQKYMGGLKVIKSSSLISDKQKLKVK